MKKRLGTRFASGMAFIAEKLGITCLSLAGRAFASVSIGDDEGRGDDGRREFEAPWEVALPEAPG